MIRQAALAVAICGFSQPVAAQSILRGIYPANSSYMVEITGSRGVTFSGSCMTTTPTNTANNDAAGTVPKTFIFEAMFVSCVVQKKQAGGTLTVRISRPDGSTVGESSTSQPYGVATLAGR